MRPARLSRISPRVRRRQQASIDEAGDDERKEHAGDLLEQHEGAACGSTAMMSDSPVEVIVVIDR